MLLWYFLTIFTFAVADLWVFVKNRYFFHNSNDYSRPLWPNFINFLHNLEGNKDIVCFEFWRYPLMLHQSNWILFMKFFLFFHISYYMYNLSLLWPNLMKFLCNVKIYESKLYFLFNLTILYLSFQTYNHCLFNWTLFFKKILQLLGDMCIMAQQFIFIMGEIPVQISWKESQIFHIWLVLLIKWVPVL